MGPYLYHVCRRCIACGALKRECHERRFFCAYGIPGFLPFVVPGREDCALSRPLSRAVRWCWRRPARSLTSSTFSDSFWFSGRRGGRRTAVRVFFPVLLLWLILQGSEQNGDLSMRRLVLIFYVAGLGYCIHPMSHAGTSPLLPLRGIPRAASQRG